MPLSARIIQVLVSTVCLHTFQDPALAEAEKCRVGFIAGLSGTGSIYGIAPLNGLQLAAADLPGRNLELLVEDDQFKPRLSVSAFRKLSQKNSAQVVVMVGSTTALAVAPLAERGSVPLIALASDRGIAIGRKQVMRTFASGEDEGADLWSEVQRRKYQRVALLFNTNDYHQSVAAGFKAAAGKDIVPDSTAPYFEEIIPTEMDLRSHAARIANKQMDAIGLCLAPGQISTMARHLRHLGSSAEFFGCTTLDNQAEAQAAQGALRDAWFVTTEVTPSFRQRYREKFGNEDFIGGAAILYQLGIQLSALCRPANQPHFPAHLLNVLLESPPTGNAVRLTPMFIDGDRYLRPPLVVRTVE